MGPQHLGRHARLKFVGRVFGSLILGVVALSVAAEPARIEDLFSRPSYSQLQLSPDGTKLAALLPINNRANLAVIDLRDMKPTVVTTFTTDEVLSFSWVSNDRVHFVQANSLDATEEVRVKRDAIIRIDGREDRDLPGRILRRMYDEDGTLIVSIASRDRASPDAFRWNPRTGRRELLTFDNPGNVRQWVTDGKGQVRIAMAEDPKSLKQTLYYRAQGEGAWRKLGEWDDGQAAIVPLAFDFDDKTLFVQHRPTGDKAGIYRYDPEQGKVLDVVLAGAQIDATGLVFDRSRKKLVFVGRSDGFGVWLDDDFKALQATVGKSLPNTRNVLSWGALSADRILVSASSDVQPVSYHLLDRASGKFEPIVASRTGGDPDSMSAAKVMRKAAKGPRCR